MAARAQRRSMPRDLGLAWCIKSLPTHLYMLPEHRRPAAAVQELGQMPLLAGAHRSQTAVTSALRAKIRQTVDWTVTREAVLGDANALRVASTWRGRGQE
jgi:hypothetical protein